MVANPLNHVNERLQQAARLAQQVVEDAMKAGIDRFGFAERGAVDRTRRDMRLEPALASEILDATARRAFLGFISRSRTKANRLDAAKELKGLVFFSNIVVAPLLEDLKVRHGCLASAVKCHGMMTGSGASVQSVRCNKRTLHVLRAWQGLPAGTCMRGGCSTGSVLLARRVHRKFCMMAICTIWVSLVPCPGLCGMVVRAPW